MTMQKERIRTIVCSCHRPWACKQEQTGVALVNTSNMDICSENREPKNKTWRWQATSLQFEGFDVDPNPALTIFGLQGLQSQAMEGRQQALQIEMGFALPKQGGLMVLPGIVETREWNKNFGGYLTRAHGRNLVLKRLEEAKTLTACRIFASLSMIYSN